MTQPQQGFLKDEIWLLTFNGAFQRNKVYIKNTIEKQRKSFREGLRGYIEDVIHPAYQKKVNDQNHGAYIISIIDYTRSFSHLLNNGELNVGAVQKLLNLSLKYYWCLGWLPEPPHFPVDSRIQKCIPAKSRKNWTAINSLEEYRTIIDCARGLLIKSESIATWELYKFKRN